MIVRVFAGTRVIIQMGNPFRIAAEVRRRCRAGAFGKRTIGGVVLILKSPMKNGDEHTRGAGKEDGDGEIGALAHDAVIFHQR